MSTAAAAVDDVELHFIVAITCNLWIMHCSESADIDPRQLRVIHTGDNTIIYNNMDFYLHAYMYVHNRRKITIIMFCKRRISLRQIFSLSMRTTNKEITLSQRWPRDAPNTWV